MGGLIPLNPECINRVLCCFFSFGFNLVSSKRCNVHLLLRCHRLQYSFPLSHPSLKPIKCAYVCQVLFVFDKAGVVLSCLKRVKGLSASRPALSEPDLQQVIKNKCRVLPFTWKSLISLRPLLICNFVMILLNGRKKKVEHHVEFFWNCRWHREVEEESWTITPQHWMWKLWQQSELKGHWRKICFGLLNQNTHDTEVLQLNYLVIFGMPWVKIDCL